MTLSPFSATWRNDVIASWGVFDESITVNNAAVPARGFTFETRTTPNTYPVPFFRPTTTDTTIAFDLFPNGSPAEVGSDLGVAWMHICNADLKADPNAAVSCIGMAAGTTAHRFGQYCYNSGTKLPIHFINEGAIVGIIGTNDEWTFQTGSVAGPNLTHKSTESGNVGPIFKSFHDSSSPAANDLIGGFQGSGRDSAGNETPYGSALVQIDDPTNGSEDSRWNFYTYVDGSVGVRAYIKSGIVVGSPTGGDQGAGTINAEGVYQNGTPLYVTGTFTPTVTLVGGAGNTTPVYSTNTGRYTRIGNRVFVDVFLANDGGAEGAGTGQVTVALPIAAHASTPSESFPVGSAQNSTTEYPLWGQVNAGASTISLIYFDTISNRTNFTGALQNNTVRYIRLNFQYEV